MKTKIKSNNLIFEVSFCNYEHDVIGFYDSYEAALNKCKQFFPEINETNPMTCKSWGDSWRFLIKDTGYSVWITKYELNRTIRTKEYYDQEIKLLKEINRQFYESFPEKKVNE